MLSAFWNTIFYQPLLNLLVFFYNLVGGDLGLAIIALTLLIKVILHPLMRQSLKSQRALQELQPKVEELKAKFKDQKERLGQELMALYKRERVSPLSSCLPILVQLPFLIALYQAFQHGLSSDALTLLYPFVQNPGVMAHSLFGWLDLSSPNGLLAILTGGAQYWQAKMLVHSRPAVKTPGSRDESLAATMNKQALYIMPVMTIIFGFNLPGGLILYWLANTVFTIIQQYLVFHHHNVAKPVVS